MSHFVILLKVFFLRIASRAVLRLLQRFSLIYLTNWPSTFYLFILFVIILQWLCNADKSSHNPRLRLKYVLQISPRLLRITCMPAWNIDRWIWFTNETPIYWSCSFFIFLILLNYFSFCSNHSRAFFESLYKCLARGARAVLQVYPENVHQRELILGFAMRSGFAGGVVVDYPHRYMLHLKKKNKHSNLFYISFCWSQVFFLWFYDP